MNQEPNPQGGGPEQSDPGQSDPGAPNRQFQVVPARRGLAWLVTATRLLRQQMWRLLTVAVIVQLIMSLTRFPLVGLVVALAIPIFTAGMLQCFHHVRRGLPLSPIVLFSPFADSRIAARLFLLGGIVGFIAIILISWLLAGVEELRDPELLARLEQGDLDAVLTLHPGVIRRAFLAVAIGVAVSGTLGYFSIPLIWFRQLSIGAALATGIKALVKNWLAFLVLGLILGALSIPLFIVMGLLVGLAAVSGGPGIIQYAVLLLSVLVIQLLMFGTQYCAYAEIFGLGGEPQQGGPVESTGTDGEFVA